MASQQNRMSPRQKMINLMYVVLMAMLALNVSSDVLNGFSLVEDSLLRTTANASASNEALYKDLQGQMEANPAKVKEWFDKAQYVKKISDSLYNYAEALYREAGGRGRRRRERRAEQGGSGGGFPCDVGAAPRRRTEVVRGHQQFS